MSILFKQFKINYWLWALVAFPLGLYQFFQPYTHTGNWSVSDWNYLMDWTRNYQMDREFWQVLGEALLRNFSLPFVVGFFVQFFIVLIWQTFRERRKCGAKWKSPEALYCPGTFGGI